MTSVARRSVWVSRDLRRVMMRFFTPVTAPLSVVWCDLVIRALDALGNAVDLLVDLGTVMVTVLTGTWDRV